MRCPYCNSDLIYEEEYYRGKPGRNVNGSQPYPIGYYSEPSSNYKVLGEIFRCPNANGFEDESEAIEYAKNNDIEYSEVSEIVCESNCHHVCGSFYTDEDGNLHNGFPC
jgi:hypothetical protein